MRTRGELGEDRVLTIAGELGLDVDRLRADMRDPAIERHIRDVYSLAETLGIRGTPAFVIGSEVIPGAVGRDRLERAISDARGTGG
jgi:predicted DsbA family dithiol-disulfide isomerase